MIREFSWLVLCICPSFASVLCLFCLNRKNLVRPGSQGKSQIWGFIDELHGLCWHDAVQVGDLSCWYPFSIPDCVLCWSFLLLSVLQIVDSRPSWILLSVLGELSSTTWIATSYVMWALLCLYTQCLVFWLSLVCWSNISVFWKKKLICTIFCPVICLAVGVLSWPNFCVWQFLQVFCFSHWLQFFMLCHLLGW